MALGGLTVEGLDGGLGVTGPVGPAQWAALGVASGAAAIGTQLPVTVSSVSDIETLIGVGPLRDLLAVALNATGGTVLVMPLQRSAGGTVIGTAARTSGTMAVTAVAGYSLGQQHVRMEWTLGGAAAVARIRLIINGVPYPDWLPGAAAYGSPLTIPAASLGPLATGVAAASQFMPTVTAPTAAVVGDGVTFDFGMPLPAGTDMAPAVTKLADHPRLFEWIAKADITTAATAALLQTAVRDLASDRGQYCGVHIPLAGPDAATGGSSATTAAWVSTLNGATTPTRMDAPRLHQWPMWVVQDDPISGYERTLPSMYAAIGKMAARQPWQPVNEVGIGDYGVLQGVESIYPADLSFEQIDSLDDVYYSTVRLQEGLTGVYIGEARPWGVFPQTGITGTDYNATERRRVMDAVCRVVRRVLQPRYNRGVFPSANGGMSLADRTDWQNTAIRGLRPMQSLEAFRDPIVTVTAPDLLNDETVEADISFIPRGKARRINGKVRFRRNTVVEEA